MATAGYEPQPLNRRRLSDFFDDDAAIAAFLGGAVPKLKVLVEQFVASRVAEERAALAHNVRGAAGNIGAEELAAAAATLEACMRGDRHEMSLEACTADLQDACARLEAAL